ncbi:hypothetical protein [Streptosporangium sp. NPDC003464]
MTMRVLLPILAAGAGAVPSGAVVPPAWAEPPAAVDLAIHSITLTPGAPVVGPSDTVRLVIEVVARGVASPDGVTVRVEPGAPPEPGTDAPADAESGPAPQTVRIPVPDAPPYVPPPQEAGPAPAVLDLVVPGHAARGRRTGPAAGSAGRAGTEWETWRFRPDKRLSRWYPAGRWTVAATAEGAGGETVTEYAEFRLRRETKFSAVQAVRRGAQVEVKGVLNRVDPQGYLDYAPFPGQSVEILHRAAPQERWTRTAEATTDLQGHFTQNVAGHRGGEWRARFTGTGRYAARHSRVHGASPS